MVVSQGNFSYCVLPKIILLYVSLGLGGWGEKQFLRTFFLFSFSEKFANDLHFVFTCKYTFGISKFRNLAQLQPAPCNEG